MIRKLIAWAKNLYREKILGRKEPLHLTLTAHDVIERIDNWNYLIKHIDHRRKEAPFLVGDIMKRWNQIWIKIHHRKDLCSGIGKGTQWLTTHQPENGNREVMQKLRCQVLDCFHMEENLILSYWAIKGTSMFRVAAIMIELKSTSPGGSVLQFIFNATEDDVG